jgi:hypothetical protein
MLRVETTGFAESRRIMQGAKIVGFATKLGNGSWGAFDPSDKRVSTQEFKTPNAVCRWFETQLSS